MSNDARVTVHLSSDGTLRGVDVEGDPDRENLVAERPSKPLAMPSDESGVAPSILPFG